MLPEGGSVPRNRRPWRVADDRADLVEDVIREETAAGRLPTVAADRILTAFRQMRRVQDNVFETFDSIASALEPPADQVPVIRPFPVADDWPLDAA